MPQYPDDTQIRIFSVKLGLDHTMGTFAIEIEYHLSARIKTSLEEPHRVAPITNGVLTLPLRSMDGRLTWDQLGFDMTPIEKAVYEEASACFATLVDCAEKLVQWQLGGEEYLINPQNGFDLAEAEGEFAKFEQVEEENSTESNLVLPDNINEDTEESDEDTL